MLIRTHLAVFVFISILILEKISEPFLFLIVGLIATFLPDIDSGNSKLGRKEISKIISAFTKHRGIFHSLFFLIFLYLLLYFYFPVLSFGFLIGYGLHLFLDCFTKRGLRIFYPFSFRLKGFIKTGGRVESVLFLFFGMGTLLISLFKIYSQVL